MKCPEQFKITQYNRRKPIVDDEDTIRGEYHLLIENQNFGECYKDECAAWSKEKQCCRKIGQ